MEFLSDLIRHHSLDLSDPLVKNSVFISLSRLFDVGFGFLFWFVAARIYPISSVGTGSALIAVLGLVILVSRLGFDIALIRYLPVRDPAVVFNTSLWTTTLFCILVSILALIIVPVISPALGIITEFSLLFILFCCASSIVSVTGTAFTALRRSSLRFVQNLILGLRFPLLVPLAILGGAGILYSIGIAYLIAAGAGIVLIAKILSVRSCVDREFLKDTIRFNFINYTSSIVHNLPALVIPLLLLNLTDSENVALFSIAFAFYNLIGVIPDSIGQAFFVEGSHGVGLKKGVLQSISLTYLFLVPAVIITVIWGSQILGIFGPRYVQALWILELLAVSRIFYNVYNIFISFQLIRWKSESLVFTSLISSGMLLCLCYLLIRPFGLAGIGYAYLVSNFLMAAGVVMYIRVKGWA